MLLRSLLALSLLAAGSVLSPASAQQVETPAVEFPDAVPVLPAPPSAALPGLASPSAAIPTVAPPAGAPTSPRSELADRLADSEPAQSGARLLGSGLLVAGVVAVSAAVVDWARSDRLGMSAGATGALLGGTGLVAWGVERRHSALAVTGAEAEDGDGEESRR